MRKFERVTGYDDAIIPTRATKGSAGYDFHILEDVEIQPNERVMLPTGIKCDMEHNEVLTIYIRSSMGVKNGLVLQNGTGIIDQDYYNNEDNEGHIHIPLLNTSDKVVKLSKGDRVAQGLFLMYCTTEDDVTEDVRIGGFGSTSEKANN